MLFYYNCVHEPCDRSALTSQWLFQLYLALECDLWIGTRNSNWNRLIDEMRCGSGYPCWVMDLQDCAEFAPCPNREAAPCDRMLSATVFLVRSRHSAFPCARRCTFTDKCSPNIYVELGHKWEWGGYHWRKRMQ